MVPISTFGQRIRAEEEQKKWGVHCSLSFKLLRFRVRCMYVGPSQCQSSTVTVTAASATQPMKTESSICSVRSGPPGSRPPETHLQH